MSKSRASYLLISDWQLLTDWCGTIKLAFRDAYGIYLVGSALHTKTFRDVDVRMIMPDEEFDKEFPDAVYYPYPRGKLAHMNTAFSIYAQKATGLPVDFQFQRAEQANAEYPSEKHPRNALGMKL